MKVKILDKGFKDFTGAFGTVSFVDGVSEEISNAEATQLGNILAVENVETGENPSVTQQMADRRDKNMAEISGRQSQAQAEPTGTPKQVFGVPNDAGDKLLPLADKTQMRNIVQNGLSYDYTEADLDALVQKEGIAGLRAFAEPYGVNGRSIAGMVKELMEQKGLIGVKQVENFTISAIQMTKTQAHEAGEGQLPQNYPGDAATALSHDGVNHVVAPNAGVQEGRTRAVDRDAADISDIDELKPQVTSAKMSAEAADEVARQTAAAEQTKEAAVAEQARVAAEKVSLAEADHAAKEAASEPQGDNAADKAQIEHLDSKDVAGDAFAKALVEGQAEAEDTRQEAGAEDKPATTAVEDSKPAATEVKEEAPKLEVREEPTATTKKAAAKKAAASKE